MNIIPAKITSTGAATTVTLEGGKSVTLDIPTPESDMGKDAKFGVRPEDLTIAEGEDFLFEGEVALTEALGEVTLYYIDGLVKGEPIIAKLPGKQPGRRGERVRFTADRSKLHLFDAAGLSYRR
jgi:alpha-glucoside transport system ATP-binding protein